ncbi:MAG TPA: lysophospholipid transporter LplT [Negativicutes bacterium]
MKGNIASLQSLFVAQFLSAFVDNMILFIALAIIKQDGYPGYYLPLVQSTFLFSYIVLSPWVGRFADKRPKAEVLMIGNAVKAVGIILLLLAVDPAVSYAVVGVGAVIYSPAKYGILPFLTRDEDELLRANSSLESYTILAILGGAVAGGYLSDLSIPVSLSICLLLYGVSIIFNKLIPKDPGNRSISYTHAISEFWADMAILIDNRQSYYSLLGTGSFWLAAAVLRMIIFAWIPMTLGITSGVQVSMIITVTGVGIAIGAVTAPYFISIKTYQRTSWFGFGMAGCMFSFLLIHSLPVAVLLLLLVGCFGGIYIVPLNTCLQHVGRRTIGTGKTIAVQNFVENMLMFLGVGAYTLAAKANIAVQISLSVVGVVLVLFLAYMLLVVDKPSKAQPS